MEKPSNMFSVCASLEDGYYLAFNELDRLVKNKIQDIYVQNNVPSRVIKITDWEDKIFPAISHGTRVPELMQTIVRVVIYEIL